MKIILLILCASLVLNFWIEAKHKENVDFGIKLKNIDLSKITFQEQLDKIIEEDNEFLNADNTTEEFIEEFWDTVQARLGLLEKLGINADSVMDGYSKHLEKIKNRPR